MAEARWNIQFLVIISINILAISTMSIDKNADGGTNLPVTNMRLHHLKKLHDKLLNNLHQQSTEIDRSSHVDQSASSIYIFPKLARKEEPGQTYSLLLEFSLKKQLLKDRILQMANLSLFVPSKRMLESVAKLPVSPNHDDTQIKKPVTGSNVKPVLSISIASQDKSLSFPLHTMDIRYSHGEWITVSVLKPLNDLRRRAMFASKWSNITVILSCPLCPGGVFPVQAEYDLAPYIALQFKERVSRVQKSATRDCSPTTTTCCRHTITVSPDRVGLADLNILFPRQVPVSYCRGTCPPRKNGSKLMDYLYGTLKIETGKSCCVPKKTAPLTILYSHKGYIFSSKLPDSQVLECGCS